MQPLKDVIKNLLGISVEAFTERYLGLPTAVGRITSGTFDHIGERSRGTMQGWSEKFLSCAAKEILIKVIIQASPLYSMSCFKLTKKVYKMLISSIAKFWWSGSLDKRSLHWLSWEKMVLPKIKGGLGFRDLEQFNIALLGKHGWRFLTHPDSLCAKVMRGKYFHNVDFMEATVPRGASATWRAIVAGREALSTGLIKRVGDGTQIRTWEDRWIPGTLSLKPMGRMGTLPLEKVSDLIIAGSGTWNVDVVRNNFLAPDADAILNIPLRANGGEDFLAWSLEKTGIYSVKTAYRALMIRKEHLALEEGTVMGTSTAEENTWKSLWKLRVLPKIRVFWWRVLRGILPDSVTLKRRHIKEIGRCEICLGSEEDLMHALISCSHAQRFWEEGRRMFDLKLPRLHQNTWAKDILCDPMFSDDQRCTIISIMYAIWSSRNRWVHDDEPYDPILSMRKIREELYMLEMQRIRNLQRDNVGDHLIRDGLKSIQMAPSMHLRGRVAVVELLGLTCPFWVLGVNLSLE
jgi:hypothetical protein